jgi:hypothetical protein
MVNQLNQVLLKFIAIDGCFVRMTLWLADRLGLASGGFATRQHAAGTEPQPEKGRYTTVWR